MVSIYIILYLISLPTPSHYNRRSFNDLKTPVLHLFQCFWPSTYHCSAGSRMACLITNSKLISPCQTVPIFILYWTLTNYNCVCLWGIRQCSKSCLGTFPLFLQSETTSPLLASISPSPLHPPPQKKVLIVSSNLGRYLVCWVFNTTLISNNLVLRPGLPV